MNISDFHSLFGRNMQLQTKFHLQPNSCFAGKLDWERDVTLNPGKRRCFLVNLECNWDDIFGGLNQPTIFLQFSWIKWSRPPIDSRELMFYCCRYKQSVDCLNLFFLCMSACCAMSTFIDKCANTWMNSHSDPCLVNMWYMYVDR